jgi:hypothetical protein
MQKSYLIYSKINVNSKCSLEAHATKMYAILPNAPRISFYSNGSFGPPAVNNSLQYNRFHVEFLMIKVYAVIQKTINRFGTVVGTSRGSVTRFFDPRILYQTIPSRALIHGLKPFRIWLRIRRENRVGKRQNRLPRSDRDRRSRFFFVRVSL